MNGKVSYTRGQKVKERTVLQMQKRAENEWKGQPHKHKSSENEWKGESHRQQCSFVSTFRPMHGHSPSSYRASSQVPPTCGSCHSRNWQGRTSGTKHGPRRWVLSALLCTLLGLSHCQSVLLQAPLDSL